MAVFAVDDPDDLRIADYRNVPDAALLEKRHLFIAEGRLVVRRLLEQKRWVTRSVMVTEPALRALGDIIDPMVPVYLVAQDVIDTVTGFNIHRGCLAIGERGAPLEWDTLARAATRLVILERETSPGAMIRSRIPARPRSPRCAFCEPVASVTSVSVASVSSARRRLRRELHRLRLPAAATA